jgi:hypothetical protein
VESDSEPAVSLLLDQLVRAVVPDLDRARPVVALRDLAVELRVLERVILDVDGQMLRPRLRRHALRNGPAGQHAVALEPEVVVEAPGVMALDDEDRLLLPRGALALGERLRGRVRVALGAVFLELLHRFPGTFPQAPLPTRGCGHAVTSWPPVLNPRETLFAPMSAKSPENPVFMRFQQNETDGEKPVDPVD